MGNLCHMAPKRFISSRHSLLPPPFCPRTLSLTKSAKGLLAGGNEPSFNAWHRIVSRFGLVCLPFDFWPFFFTWLLATKPNCGHSFCHGYSGPLDRQDLTMATAVEIAATANANKGWRWNTCKASFHAGFNKTVHWSFLWLQNSLNLDISFLAIFLRSNCPKKLLATWSKFAVRGPQDRRTLPRTQQKPRKPSCRHYQAPKFQPHQHHKPMPAGFQGTAPWLLWQDRRKTMCCLGPKSTHTQPCRQLPGPRTCALCWCTSRDTEFPVWGMLPSGPHFLRTRRRRFGFEVHPAKPTTKQWLALLPKQRLWFSRYSSGAGTAEPRIFFFSSKLIRGSSFAGRKATQLKVGWKLVASPQELKDCFLQVFRRLRDTGKRRTPASSFFALNGIRLIRPARARRPPE